MRLQEVPASRSIIPVSVFIITLNEERHLLRLLPQLLDFDEVVIVDSGSTDRTESIARCFSNVRFSTHAWQGFGRQKEHALNLCSNEWVLNLDADEELTEHYLSQLRACIASGEADALQSRRKLLRWGRVPKSFIKDDVLIRLFRKSRGRYTNARVHERVLVEGTVRNTEALILHHENLTFSQRVYKANQYSQLKAEDKFSAGASCTLLHVQLAFPLAFLQCYFLKGCFLDGGHGVLTSMNHAFYSFMKYAKLWELYHLMPLSEHDKPAVKPEAFAELKQPPQA